MSVQFGRWNFDGKPVTEDYLQQVGSMLRSYGPDLAADYKKDHVAILYHAFHTTKESHYEIQPFHLASGAVLIWDGRLDNRESLISQLLKPLPADSPDVSIVTAAYEQWSTDCFAKLIGDWALAVWNPLEQSLTLAKDFVGTRPLYYSLEKDRATWSTVLDPLVLLAGHSFDLEEEYIAGWFSFFPAAHLTPYVGIRSVPPSSFIRITREKTGITKYWDFNPSGKIRYRSDREYEEHFRTVFAEAVRRRLRSDSPVLAELSGGMDSSSIVCVADKIIDQGRAETPRLDTVSYYDDSEPNWNERPYFTKVEERRRRPGCLIDVARRRPLTQELEYKHFVVTPATMASPNEPNRALASLIVSQRNRALLSGIGGDEVLGGVPTPAPELEDLFARAQFRQLLRQLQSWALTTRKPLIHLFLETLREFLPNALVRAAGEIQPPAWLDADFTQRNRTALLGYPSKIRAFGPLPSFQENLAALDLLRRQIGCTPQCSEPPCEKRYPYLDRDLLEFLFHIPREQLVRPGLRRSLMRRALIGIVPDDILSRKRKAFAARGNAVALGADWDNLCAISRHLVTRDLGIVDAEGLLQALQEARRGRPVMMVALLRTLGIEFWLRAARNQSVFQGFSGLTPPRNAPSHAATGIGAGNLVKSSAS